MDALSLSARGIENVVAPLGTSMTEEQAKLLARYCSRVYLLFDSDPAGLRASFRAGDVLLAAGLHPSVVTLPPGEDPDTVVQKEGPEGIRDYLSQAVDVLDRKLQILEERDYFSSIERTRGAVDRLLPTLRAAKDPALRDIYVAKVAERTGVRRETLETELSKRGVGYQARPKPGARPVSPPRGLGRPVSMGAERKLLLLLSQFRDYVDLAAERLGAEEFSHPSFRAVFQALVDDPELTHPPADMDPSVAAEFEGLLASEERISEASRVFEDSIGQIKEGQLAARAEDLRAAMRQEKDPAKQQSLMRELDEISRLRREMKIDWRTAIRRRQDPLDQSP
jgi:DNA primase